MRIYIPIWNNSHVYLVGTGNGGSFGMKNDGLNSLALIPKEEGGSWKWELSKEQNVQIAVSEMEGETLLQGYLGKFKMCSRSICHPYPNKSIDKG